MDVDTNLRTTTCWRRDMWKICRSYCLGWRSPGFCMDPNQAFLHTVGTERMTTSSLLPFRSFPCSLERGKTCSHTCPVGPSRRRVLAISSSRISCIHGTGLCVPSADRISFNLSIANLLKAVSRQEVRLLSMVTGMCH